MVTFAEHKMWSRGGYVDAFRLKSVVNSVALSSILFPALQIMHQMPSFFMETSTEPVFYIICLPAAVD